MLAIRLDPAIHRAVKQAALDAHTTVAAWTVAAIREKLLRGAHTGPTIPRPPAPSDLPPRRPISKADSCK